MMRTLGFEAAIAKMCVVLRFVGTVVSGKQLGAKK